MCKRARIGKNEHFFRNVQTEIQILIAIICKQNKIYFLDKLAITIFYPFGRRSFQMNLKEKS